MKYENAPKRNLNPIDWSENQEGELVKLSLILFIVVLFAAGPGLPQAQQEEKPTYSLPTSYMVVNARIHLRTGQSVLVSARESSLVLVESLGSDQERLVLRFELDRSREGKRPYKYNVAAFRINEGGRTMSRLAEANLELTESYSFHEGMRVPVERVVILGDEPRDFKDGAYVTNMWLRLREEGPEAWAGLEEELRKDYAPWGTTSACDLYSRVIVCATGSSKE